MDEFDVIDFIFDAVEPCATGLVVYKDKSETGVEVDHIVINHLQCQELDYLNVIPVNVNIFLKLKSNGMVDRQRMKTLKRDIRKALNSINLNDGKYRELEILWSEKLNEAKDGFDCMNIRINVSTEKN